MAEFMFSVVIPLYNQIEQLIKTLHMFARQVDVEDLFEVIVVNDGSLDVTREELACLSERYTFPLSILEIAHSGSAAARNAGTIAAKGEFLVFCDADRFPCENYLRAFRKLIESDLNVDQCVFQGRVMDCFATQINIYELQKMIRFSRESQYYRKIMKLYAGKQFSSSGLVWLSYLVGNSCIKKIAIEKAGMFDEHFSEWGFEHFDLGLRLMQRGMTFVNAVEAVNYHIPHSKGQDVYKQLFEKSAAIMNKKYPQYDGRFSNLTSFLCGEISLQELEQCFCGTISNELLGSSLIYYKL